MSKNNGKISKGFGISGKVLDRLAASNSISNLTDFKKLQKGLKWKLGIYFAQILDALESYTRMKKELLNEFGLRDRHGNLIESETGSGVFLLKDETKTKYFEQLDDLRETEIEMGGDKFELSYPLVEEALSSKDLAFLSPIIDFLDTDKDD